MNKNPKYKHLTAHKWIPGQSGNKAGRPKSYVTVLKELGYTKPVIATMTAEFMIMPMEDVYKIAEHGYKSKEPAIRVGIAMAFKKFGYTGEYKYVSSLMDIAFEMHVPHIPHEETKNNILPENNAPNATNKDK